MKSAFVSAVFLAAACFLGCGAAPTDSAAEDLVKTGWTESRGSDCKSWFIPCATGTLCFKRTLDASSLKGNNVCPKACTLERELRLCDFLAMQDDVTKYRLTKGALALSLQSDSALIGYVDLADTIWYRELVEISLLYPEGSTDTPLSVAALGGTDGISRALVHLSMSSLVPLSAAVSVQLQSRKLFKLRVSAGARCLQMTGRQFEVLAQEGSGNPWLTEPFYAFSKLALQPWYDPPKDGGG